MKTRLILALFIAALWLAIGTLFAQPGHRGWPNHGISAPGQPNHYASPKPIQHP